MIYGKLDSAEDSIRRQAQTMVGLLAVPQEPLAERLGLYGYMHGSKEAHALGRVIKLNFRTRFRHLEYSFAKNWEESAKRIEMRPAFPNDF